MPTLYTVLQEVEEDLKRAISSAWDTPGFGPIRRVLTDVPETDASASSLPEVALLMPVVEAGDDELGSFCSESASIEIAIYLHAMKPKTGALMAEKRMRAQQLRTTLKQMAEAGFIRHVSLLVWQADHYQEQEDFLQAAISDAYVIRVVYQATVEWQEGDL